ncbi:transposase [Alkalihalobacillus sp. MEB130]|uniref:transposase n=1 Tax=Alkalihalobacillus sp. MEB130 TaxID=2976704 RepID=UPI0028DE0F55|nr:transposase [Alkalihalobacillus sp. MEB130]MDT8858927.1 transposase [Alkalihalobacillus sp. MEB130]
MPRKARTKSRSGIYHIMLRGINKQLIFEDDEDKRRFLEVLKRYKERCHFQLYGYCLMNNHVHLLMREGDEPLSLILKRISSSYVYWYNNKYDRFGHLFQERFKSENVEDRAYFLTVLRYIHQNPLKAGLSPDVFDSSWTSIQEYTQKATIVDVDLALNQFSANRKTALVGFKAHMQQITNDRCLDEKVIVRISDSEIMSYMRELGISNSSVLQQLDRESRNDILRELKKLNGISIRQLSRVTGVSKSVIQRLT